MKRFLALALVAIMVSLGLPGLVSAASPRLQATVTGTARTMGGNPINGATVRLRNTGTGQPAGTTTTAGSGEFVFKNVPPGNYVVELIDNNGAVAATSMPVTVVDGEMVTGVALTASVGKAGIGAVAGANASHFFKSAKGIALLAGAGAGIVAGVVAVSTDKSPSR